MLDNLIARGYTIVIHLGARINDLTLAALHRSETILTPSAEGAKAEHEALLQQLTAAGLHERIQPQAMPIPAAAPVRGRRQVRPREQATNPLPVAA